MLATAAVLAIYLSPVAADAAAPRTTLGTERYAGSDRYETAARTALASYRDGADTVILARGDAFPDGLAAAFLAGVENAPILLTRSDALPAATADAIHRLEAKDAIVVGGTAAVGHAVVDQLYELVDNLDRIQGRDRYHT